MGRMVALHSKLRRRKLTVAVAESCTGGLLAAVDPAAVGAVMAALADAGVAAATVGRVVIATSSTRVRLR